jgi:DNA polymerase
VDAVFSFAMNGVMTAGPFSGGLFHSRIGTMPLWSWSEKTTTGPTHQRIAAWQHVKNSAQTLVERIACPGAAEFSRLKNFGLSIALGINPPARSHASCAKENLPSRSSPRKPVAEEPTYDIVNCGPRSRFTIRTDAGVVIAHNCLFGQGPDGLIEYAKGYGVTLTKERSKEVVDAYRAEYAKVKTLWYECSDAAISATRNPGQWFEAGDKLSLCCHKGFLWMKLPSGRLISWARPEVEMQQVPWVNKDGVREMRPVVTVESIDTYTRQFCRHKLIGSSIFQSAVQGTARDILANAVLKVEPAGYPVVLMAHDEMMALVPEGFGDAEEFGRLMCEQAVWCKDLPLSFEAWRGKRFKK